MAEINIRRKGPSFWPSVIGLFAIIAVVWIWAAADGPVETDRPMAELAPLAETPAAGTAGTSGMGDGAIREFAEFAGVAGTGPGTPEMGLDHEYTAEGLRKLGAALDSLVVQRPSADAQARLDRFRAAAERIQQEASSMGHADRVRDAFMMATDVIAAVNAEAGGDLRAAAGAIDTSEPLLEQHEAVRTFFRQSAEAIRRAADRTT